KIITEIPASIFHLSGFEPVHIVVDVGHSSGKLLASSLQTRQTLGDSSVFTAREQSRNLLVFTCDRAQNRIRSGNKQQQVMVQLIQRYLLMCRNFAMRKFL